VFMMTGTVIYSLGHGLRTCTAVSRLTQPSIPRVAKLSTSFGCGSSGNVTSVGWEVTLCDPRSDVAMLHCELLIRIRTF